MNTIPRWRLFVLALAVMSSATGCQTPDWSVSKSWHKLWNPDPKEKKSLFQTPARVVALWSPAMYNTPGKPATRGFGGRLYFYNHKDEPIPIEGQLVVFAYNDSVQQVDGRKPDRKFVFTSEQLSTHFSPAELGASYSIWIPWDAVGGQQLEISLLPIFTATSGQVVMAEQSRNVLPGTTTPAANSQTQQSSVQPIIIDHRVAPVSYQAPVDLGTSQPGAAGVIGQQSYYTHVTQPAPVENIRTTAIQLTRGMAERLTQERMQQQPPQLLTPPNTTYPLPAGILPPNMVGLPGYQAQPTVPISTPTFNVPRADSRSRGPTLQRTQASQGSSLPGSQTPIGQSPTRYAPGRLPAPVKANPQPTSGPQPTPPGPAAPEHLPPSTSLSSPYPSGPVGYQTGSAGG